MNYTDYVPTEAEIAAILASNRQDELEFQERVLHDLLELGRDIVNVTRQKAFVQGKHLARDPREIELRHHQDLTIPFERLARGIRQAILLHQKTLDLLKPPSAGATALPSDPPAAPKTGPDRPDDETREPPDRVIVKACQNIAAAFRPDAAIPDTGPRAAIETLRAHLATTFTAPP